LPVVARKGEVGSRSKTLRVGGERGWSPPELVEGDIVFSPCLVKGKGMGVRVWIKGPRAITLVSFV